MGDERLRIETHSAYGLVYNQVVKTLKPVSIVPLKLSHDSACSINFLMYIL